MANTSPDYEQELSRQMYEATIRGMKPYQVAQAFGRTVAATEKILEKERERRAEEWLRTQEENDAESQFTIDQIDAFIMTGYQKLDAENAPPNPSGILSNIYKGIELRAKVRGLLVNRVAGADGQSPIEISASNMDRQRMLEEIEKLLPQQKRLEQSVVPNIIDVEQD